MKRYSFALLSLGIMVAGILILSQIDVKAFDEAIEPESLPTEIPTDALASSLLKTGWIEGSEKHSTVTNCITGYPEYGVAVWVAYWQQTTEEPKVNDVYYLALVVYGMGYPCYNMYTDVNFALPPNTSLAIDSTNKVTCFGGTPGNVTQFTPCPQTLPAGINPGTYRIPSDDTTIGRTWPTAASSIWEFHVPVRTSTTLSGSNFTGYFHIIDGEGSPWLYPTVPIYVFNPPPPGSFNKLSPTSGTTGLSTSPTISWGTSSGATAYSFCYDTSNDNACSSWVNNGTATSKSLSGLAADTTYYWHVRATNSGGTTYANGSNTAFWSFKTISAPKPGVFNKLNPVNGATGISTSPTISWGASSGATSYKYCYDKTNDNSCATWINNGTARTKTLSGLTPNTTYYWHVKAVNATGTTYANGSGTAFWSFKTKSATKPGAFIKRTPANGTTNVSTSPTISWGASSGATLYKYCYDKTNDNSCTTWVNNGTARIKILSGLTPNTTYYWHVKAVNSNGTTYANGSSTAFWSFKTNIATKPGSFNKLYPSDHDLIPVSNLTLMWGTSSNVVNYEYCIDTLDNNACDASWISRGSNTSVTITGLQYETDYYWQVRAKNPAGIRYANSGVWWNFETDVSWVVIPIDL